MPAPRRSGVQPARNLWGRIGAERFALVQDELLLDVQQDRTDVIELDDNAAIYGKKLTNREVVQSSTPVPSQAQPLISVLTKYSSAKNAN